MNKNVIIVLAVVLGLLLLAGVVFAVSKYGTTIQTSLQKTAAPVNPTQKTVTAPNAVKLEITNSVDKTTVKASMLTVTGVTLPGADVSINEVSLKANVSGNFSGNIKLEEGDNPVIIDVVDTDGNSVQKEITVTYEP